MKKTNMLENASLAPTAINILCEQTPDEKLMEAFGDLLKAANDRTALRSVYDYGRKALTSLENISRLDAYRLFSSLPIPLFYPDTAKQAPSHIKDDEVLGVQSLYALTAAYLFSWHLGIVIKAEAHDCLEPAHDRAVVSDRRYQMIRRMCELDMFRTDNPAMHWILAEASECLLGLKAGQGQSAITSNRQRYEAQQRYIKGLKGKQSNEQWHPYPESFEEELMHYSRWIEARARQLAEEKTKAGRKFRKQYFKPYTDALTVSNSNQWNKYAHKLASVGTKPKRSGSKLGSKNYKC